MGNDHRGRPTGDNHVPMSRRARADLKSLVETSGGNLWNVPSDQLHDFFETHGHEHVPTVINAVQNHGETLRVQAYKKSAREQKIKEIKDAITSKVAPYRATAFEVNQAYGGPEEGGWWYEQAHPVATSRPHITRRGAEKEAQRMQSAFPQTGASRSVRGMSAYDAYRADSDIGEASDSDWNDYQEIFSDPEADYKVRVQRGKGKPTPETRPHYE